MTTSPASEQQSSIFAVNNDSIDSMLASAPAPTRIEQCNFSALQEETEDPQSVGAQDGVHLVPGPGEGRTASESGDVVNEQLLHDEQLDIEAVRSILALPVVTNAITVKHYRWIAMSLREKLLLGDPHEIPFGAAYARILLRLVGRLEAYPGCNWQRSDDALYSRPRDYVECLSKLLADMAEGFVLNRQTGVEDDVFIVRNQELHTDHLCSLASRLRGA